MRYLFCMNLRSFGINFAATRRTPKSFTKIFSTDQWEMFKTPDITLLVNLRLLTNISFTLSMFSSVFGITGLPLRSSYLIESRPILSLASHWKMTVFLESLWRNSFPIFPTFAHHFTRFYSKLIQVRCSNHTDIDVLLVT